MTVRVLLTRQRSRPPGGSRTEFILHTIVGNCPSQLDEDAGCPLLAPCEGRDRIFQRFQLLGFGLADCAAEEFLLDVGQITDRQHIESAHAGLDLGAVERFGVFLEFAQFGDRVFECHFRRLGD